MYWNNYHPYYHSVGIKSAGEGKYSTEYLMGNIGREIRVVLNYSTTSVLNQNVQYMGTLKEVGNDYFVVTVLEKTGIKETALEKTGIKEDVFIYTVNLGRATFPSTDQTLQPPAQDIPVSSNQSTKKRRIKR